MTNHPTMGITVTRNEIIGSARVDLNLGGQARPLAYRVTRQPGSDHYLILDPFGAAIDGVPSLERALEIATGLAQHVCEWAGDRFDRRQGWSREVGTLERRTRRR